MQRLCTKLRFLALQSTQTLPSLSASRRLLHHSSPPIHFISTKWSFEPFLNNSVASPPLAVNSFSSSPLLLSVNFRFLCISMLVQVRHVSSRERAKRRKPMTPRTSKLKKIKMKSYSSYKSRFRTMNDGNIRRWREGKNHNAHLKVMPFLYCSIVGAHMRVPVWCDDGSVMVRLAILWTIFSFKKQGFLDGGSVMVCLDFMLEVNSVIVCCLMQSKKSRRRLRQPAIVPAAYAKVMKKLNFCT
ncbi:DNA-methyltransferase CMT2 [Gossypium australe]|uniref:DNA-methyltransferase CMT2 n=1 Tax=Gossypium australe TaxID=47621 RepID=A0A5B6VJP7_9ROSI|nr:DNA-methyltransferase CMT2 [Gossypium australe]